MLTLLYWICDLMSFIVSINSCLSSPQLFLLIPSVCLSHTLAPFARMPVAGTLDFLISSHSIWVLSSIFSTLFLLVSCFGNLHRATFMSSDSLAVLSLVIRLWKLSFFIYLYVYFFPPVFPTDSLIVSFCRNSPSARACCIFVRLSIYSFLHLVDMY